MSHNTWSDVVPFVIFDFINRRELRDDHPWWGVEAWVEGEMCEDDEEVNKRDINTVELNGWRYLRYSSKFGKHKSLSGDVWTDRENHKIFIINTSQYSHVGEYDMSVCANDLEAIEAFKHDFVIPGKIEDNESVQQSG